MNWAEQWTAEIFSVHRINKFELDTYLARAILTCDNPLSGNAKVSTLASLLLCPRSQKRTVNFLSEILRPFITTRLQNYLLVCLVFVGGLIRLLLNKSALCTFIICLNDLIWIFSNNRIIFTESLLIFSKFSRF